MDRGLRGKTLAVGGGGRHRDLRGRAGRDPGQARGNRHVASGSRRPSDRPAQPPPARGPRSRCRGRAFAQPPVHGAGDPRP